MHFLLKRKSLLLPARCAKCSRCKLVAAMHIKCYWQECRKGRQYYNFHFRITISILILLSVTLQPCLPKHQGLAFQLKVKWQMILKNLCRMQLSPTVATSAITRAQELLISRDISGNIHERSLSNAINVTSPADQLLTSRNTCGNIREKSLSSATNVATLVQKLVDSSHIC